MTENRVSLFLMTEKGFRVLEALCGPYRHLIDQVISSRDSAVAKDFFEEIQAFCILNAIPFSERSDAQEVQTPFSLAISWRWMIRSAGSELIVFHDSLLPRHRGFSPLVTCLINGERTIGVTSLFANEEFDRGDIIAQSQATIEYPIKIQEAIELISGCYVELALVIADKLNSGEQFPRTKQSEEQATYSLWRDELDYLIDWSSTAVQIKRFIDAVGWPYKGASTYADGRMIRVHDSEVVEDVVIENRNAGKVLFVEAQCPIIVCGSGLLRLTDVRSQDSSKKLLPWNRLRTRFTSLNGQ